MTQKTEYRIATRNAETSSRITLTEVPEDTYRGIDRMTAAYRKKMQRLGKCIATRLKAGECLMDCETCPHRSFGKDSTSLEAAGIDEYDPDDYGSDSPYVPEHDRDTIVLYIESRSRSPEDIVIQKVFNEELRRAVNALPPEARAMVALYIDGRSQRKMSEELDIPLTTLNRRWKKILDQLHDELKDWGD